MSRTQVNKHTHTGHTETDSYSTLTGHTAYTHNTHTSRRQQAGSRHAVTAHTDRQKHTERLHFHFTPFSFSYNFITSYHITLEVSV